MHWRWAAWASFGVILSACYLLWSYQRVFFGEVSNEKNRDLPDTDAREKWTLVAMALVILVMGNQFPFLHPAVRGFLPGRSRSDGRTSAAPCISAPVLPPEQKVVATSLERAGTR